MSDNTIPKKQLIELNEQLENYFRNTIIPQLYIDAGMVLRKFTPPAMKQFDLSDNDLGKHIDEIVDNIRFPTIMEDIQQVIDTGEILEKEIQTNDLRWYQMNIIPYIVYETNAMNGVIITFVDITRRIKDLNDSERMISDYETLLDMLSHGIKNPLTNLRLAIDHFKSSAIEDPQESQTLLQIVDRALEKMHTIVNELTETRKAAYRHLPEGGIVDFAHILEDVRLTLSVLIKESGARITSHIEAPVVNFSQRKLRSIIYNLLSNAIKFRSPDRRAEISVTTRQEGDHVLISVKDNGIGIDPTKTDAIFTKYFRLENSIEGSGIGLYLVKEIVQNAGGSVSVESGVGKGSEFRIYIKNPVNP